LSSPLPWEHPPGRQRLEEALEVLALGTGVGIVGLLVIVLIVILILRLL
jgi:hypothetical protein